jgi:hypothetical protein
MLLSILSFTTMYTLFSNQETLFTLFNDFLGRSTLFYHQCLAYYNYTESLFDTLYFALTGESSVGETAFKIVLRDYSDLDTTIVEKRFLDKMNYHVFKFAYPSENFSLESAPLNSLSLAELVEKSQYILSAQYNTEDLTGHLREFAGQLQVSGESVTFENLEHIKMYLNLEKTSVIELVTKDLETVNL